MEPLTLEQRDAAEKQNIRNACRKHDLNCRLVAVFSGWILGIFTAFIAYIIFF